MAGVSGATDTQLRGAWLREMYTKLDAQTDAAVDELNHVHKDHGEIGGVLGALGGLVLGGALGLVIAGATARHSARKMQDEWDAVGAIGKAGEAAHNAKNTLVGLVGGAIGGGVGGNRIGVAVENHFRSDEIDRDTESLVTQIEQNRMQLRRFERELRAMGEPLPELPPDTTQR